MSDPITQVYDFDERKRGDSFPSLDIAKIEQPAGTPLEVTSAIMQVRHGQTGAVLLEWDSEADPATITITGAGSNIVTLAAKSAEVMADIPVGVHVYDLEVTLATGETITPIGGAFPISKDISRRATT